jgi:glutamine amidotransferase
MGIFEETVKKFVNPSGELEKLKVPHMGWNNIFNLRTGLFRDIEEEEHVYFVHSYYAASGKDTIANCNYGETFSAALHRDNFYATQFHPEKSGNAGSKILKNFIDL